MYTYNLKNKFYKQKRLPKESLNWLYGKQNLSWITIIYKNVKILLKKVPMALGTFEGIRTPDPRLRSLYYLRS